MSHLSADDPVSIRRRRLLFRSWHRGTREMDLLMGRFADARVPSMTVAELDLFEALIEAQDRDLFRWITDAEPVADNYDSAIWRELKAFHDHAAPLHV